MLSPGISLILYFSIFRAAAILLLMITLRRDASFSMLSHDISYAIFAAFQLTLLFFD